MKNYPLVQIQAVSRIYAQADMRVHALSRVGLNIEAGEFTALMGPSGSGKTTLLNLIGGLDKPDLGSIRIGADHLDKMSHGQLAALRLRKIGFVFQEYNLIPVLSALENVEYVLVLQKVPARERRARAESALRAVGLGDYMHRRPTQMSGGQQQRVAVARAIVGKPLLVLADEPTANLDSETGEALLKMMLRLNTEDGVTFVFSTHDDMVRRHARRIVHMKDGMIAEDGQLCAS